MAEYRVTRYEGARPFPNGVFGRKADAEKHAEYVRSFHDVPAKAVRVERVGPEEADDAGEVGGPEAAA